MKSLLLPLLLVFASTSINAQLTKTETSITLKGTFQGKNVYVQNPFASNGVGFCVTKCLINGEPPCRSSAAFEIDLYCHQLKLGDPVEIIIEHKKGCAPRILNPEVLRPRSTFKIEHIEVSTSGFITWTTTGESGPLEFVVEQYKWNKWVPIGRTMGDGIKAPCTYSLDISRYIHGGTNTFRVKQVDHTGKPRYSGKVEMEAENPGIEIDPTRRKFGKLTFSAPTQYEIYSAYGALVKKGFGFEIDISNLKRGPYYLNYGNKNEKFLKR